MRMRRLVRRLPLWPIVIALTLIAMAANAVSKAAVGLGNTVVERW